MNLVDEYRGGWVKPGKTSVHHWRFETGEPEPVPTWMNKIYPSGYRDGAPRGWYCWVYPADDHEFEQWMAVHCPTAECTHRFNSGNPMYTVTITDEAECMLFKLKFEV